MTLDDTVGPLDDDHIVASAWSAGTIQVRLIEIGVAGALAALALIFAWLQLRPDLKAAAATPFFWFKGLYTAALVPLMLVGAVGAVARPGASPRPLVAASGAIVAVMLIAAGVEAPHLSASLVAHIFDLRGMSACFVNIVSLAVPMLIVAGVGLRRVALERPGLTGLLVGLFCGAVSATVYGLHCQDSTFTFVVLWYSSGIALCGLIGAAGLKTLHRRSLGDRFRIE